jgi:hypothetical protein
LTWNLLHLTRMLERAGGIPAHGNQRTRWDAGFAPTPPTRAPLTHPRRRARVAEPVQVSGRRRRRRPARERGDEIVSIMSRLSKVVRSLTADKPNTDVPPGVRVPSPDEGAVPMPDREPMAGFEPKRDA